jgi:hypothetical protein
LVPGALDLRLPGAVREADHRIGVGDVEVVADQRHAERRVQVLEEHRLELGRAVVAQAAQQVMRLALGVAAPARFIACFWT